MATNSVEWLFSQFLQVSSFPLKLEFVTIGSDFYPISGLELSFEQFHGERIQQLLPPSLRYGGTGLHGALR